MIKTKWYTSVTNIQLEKMCWEILTSYENYWNVFQVRQIHRNSVLEHAKVHYHSPGKIAHHYRFHTKMTFGKPSLYNSKSVGDPFPNICHWVHGSLTFWEGEWCQWVIWRYHALCMIIALRLESGPLCITWWPQCLRSSLESSSWCP